MLLNMLAHILCTFLGVFFAMGALILFENMRDHYKEKKKQRDLEDKLDKERYLNGLKNEQQRF